MLLSREHKIRLDIQRFLSLLCVLLIAFTGLVQAVHVHTENSKLPAHDCSVCSVAHSAAATSPVYRPAPVFIQACVVVPQDAPFTSAYFASELCIRPPPAA